MMANDIVLTFDFETAPAAEDLGEVFAALSRDYRDLRTGGTLVVTRIDSGSIIVSLTDAVLAGAPYAIAAIGGTITTMAAINTVEKFAENLNKWFGRAKTDEGKKQLYKKGRKSPGQRSVEAIIKTAAKTGSRAKVRHTKPNGETLEAEISPAEAVEIRDAAAQKPELAAPLVSSAFEELKARPAIDAAVERLRLAGSQNLSQTQIEAIVDIIVTALNASGSAHALPEIALQLETHGLFDFAVAVRRHI